GWGKQSFAARTCRIDGVPVSAFQYRTSRRPQGRRKRRHTRPPRPTPRGSTARPLSTGMSSSSRPRGSSPASANRGRERSVSRLPGISPPKLVSDLRRETHTLLFPKIRRYLTVHEHSRLVRRVAVQDNLSLCPVTVNEIEFPVGLEIRQNYFQDRVIWIRVPR